MPTQLPRVPSLIPSSFATLAIGRDVSITIFTASSLNSGEKLFLGRGNYFTFPDGPSYWMDCPEGSGHLIVHSYADHELADRGWRGRPPGAPLAGVVPFACVTSRRCQVSSVAGVTVNTSPLRCRGISR